MKLNRIGSFIVLGLVLMVILSQSASVAVKAQVNATVSATISQQPRPAHPTDQNPYKITVQGRLTDPSGNPITTQVNVSFKLYNVASGGSPIFSEGPVSVTPDNRGLLTYQLGSTSVISTALVSEFAGSLYLGLTVGSDSEMAPRILLTASPYAMSLAPGTVVRGAYATNALTTTFGVINGVNLDLTTVTNAGVYGKGSTGIYGEADPSGGFGALAGNFVNSGGYSGPQFGLSAISNSTGGTDGYGGFFGSYGGGSGAQYGIYALAGASTGHQQEEDSAGVVGISVASSSADTSAGGIFTSTNTYHSAGAIGYGTTGVQGVGNSTSTYPSIGGSFVASGNSSNVLGVNGNATAAGSNNATGVQGYGSGGTSPYGGYFHSTNGIGVYAYADQPGLAAQFDSNNSNAIIVRVFGRIGATGCCAGANYDIQVRYHGSDTLHPGDILAADGLNETFQGIPTLGVVKATADNAAAAIGVVQYPIHKGITDKDGHEIWNVDDKAGVIQPNELATAIVLGQVQVHLGSSTLHIGDRLTLDDAGKLSLATKGADNIIGKVVSQPDKDGYVTVFVNLK